VPETTVTPTAKYNSNNQVTWTTVNAAVNGFVYDEAGDAVGDNLNQYLYDAEGRICAVANTPVPSMSMMTGYIYDAEGTRVAKGSITEWSCDPAVNGFQTTSDYIIGPSGEQMTEMGMDLTTNTLTRAHANVWAGGKLLATYDNDYALHFYLDDPLGTRRVQTDSAGVVEQTCQSLPYGDGETCAPTPTEQLFTGKERDAESGNDYFEARYYSSAMGRFMSPDWSAKAEPVPYAKMDNPQSLNLYAYVLNNPLSKVDPDGHLGCGFLWLGNCPAPPPPPPPPPTPKPPPVPPPPPLTYKPNVPVPAPNTGLGKLLQCTNQCMNPTPIGVSSTSETVPGHPEIHGPDTPHGRGEAADLTPGKKEAKQTMWCSAQCGAGFGQNEYDHPSAHATGGHDHVQTGEGRGGSRGDLPADEHPEQPQE
jgi:RHS repeat-associated protein